MPTRSITLDESHFEVISKKAQALGKTPAQYLQALIDSAALDEALAPVREAFAESGMTDDQLSDFLEVVKHRRRKERRNAG